MVNTSLKFEDLRRVGCQGCQGLTDSSEGCESLQDDLADSAEGERVVEGEGMGEGALLVEQGAFVEMDSQTLEKLSLTIERSEIHLIARASICFGYPVKLNVIPRVCALTQ